MTNITTDDTRLLVLFGEMRGDLKALLRSQEDLTLRIKQIEAATNTRYEGLDERLGSLERIRVKVGAYTAALAFAAGLFSDKLSTAAGKITSLFGA